MAAPLPASLIERTAIDELLASTFGDRVFMIGGRVRDAYISHYHGLPLSSKDHDYVLIGVEFETARERLESLGRLDLVGASFGVLKLTRDGHTHDISLGRTERSNGWGHRDVEATFTPDVTIEEDARRRDITINTLSVRVADRALVQPIPDVIDDIRNRRIDVISEQTIEEDPLRMLRCVQFASRFDFAITDRTAKFIRANAHQIQRITPERIQTELDKLLGRSPDPLVGLVAMRNLGLTPYIVPELTEAIGVEQNKFHRYTVEMHLFHTAQHAKQAGGDLEDVWAALLHDIGKPRTAAPRADGKGNSFYGHEAVGADMARDILRRLRYSDRMVERITSLVGCHMYATQQFDGRLFSDSVLRRFLRKTTMNGEHPDLIEKQFRLRTSDIIGSGRSQMLRAAENQAFEERVLGIRDQQPALTFKGRAINGRDVIALMKDAGWKPKTYIGDAAVGEMLTQLLEDVIEQPQMNTRAGLVGRTQAKLREKTHQSVSSVIRTAEDVLAAQGLPPRFHALDVNEVRSGAVLAANGHAFVMNLAGGVYSCHLTAHAGISPEIGQIVIVERTASNHVLGRVHRPEPSRERSIA